MTTSIQPPLTSQPSKAPTRKEISAAQSVLKLTIPTIKDPDRIMEAAPVTSTAERYDMPNVFVKACNLERVNPGRVATQILKDVSGNTELLLAASEKAKRPVKVRIKFSDDGLFDQIERAAALESISLSQFVNQCLRAFVLEKKGCI